MTRHRLSASDWMYFIDSVNSICIATKGNWRASFRFIDLKQTRIHSNLKKSLTHVHIQSISCRSEVRQTWWYTIEQSRCVCVCFWTLMMPLIPKSVPWGCSREKSGATSWIQTFEDTEVEPRYCFTMQNLSRSLKGVFIQSSFNLFFCRYFSKATWVIDIKVSLFFVFFCMGVGSHDWPRGQSI